MLGLVFLTEATHPFARAVRQGGGLTLEPVLRRAEPRCIDLRASNGRAALRNLSQACRGAVPAVHKESVRQLPRFVQDVPDVVPVGHQSEFALGVVMGRAVDLASSCAG